MKIYGQHVQPYPPQRCLSPKQHNNYTVTLATKSFNFLKIRLPEPLIHKECLNISIASVKYMVYYAKYVDGSDCDQSTNCTVLVTTNKTYVLADLKPYTKYLMRVAVSNDYTMKNEIIIGPPSVFQTAAGGN